MIITDSKTFATLLQQKDDHAQIEEILIVLIVLEENRRLKEEKRRLEEEIGFLNAWQRVLENAQPSLKQFLSQVCQLQPFNGVQAVISVPEGYRPQEKEKSLLIEAVFRKVGHPAKVRFMFKPNP
ncbi:MAG: hypothetical protein V7K14_26700 [Nostoc sp.]|uniref:hypothetical protein n=1 Tax=Nostoc sp. TaxID=1180 RepID=UPI002FF7E30E